MGFGFRTAIAAAALMSAGLVSSPSWAGDDGDAPLWKGVGAIFSPVIGFTGLGGGEKPPPIDYRERGKLVLPKSTDLPPPGAAAAAAADPSWPVNQEILRKKKLKEEGKKSIAGVGDARLRYSHGFPANEPVTIRAIDPDGQTVRCTGGGCGSSSSVLSNLNPLKWVGMDKSSTSLGPEPDRDWLTDPPKGFRAPVQPVQGSSKN